MDTVIRTHIRDLKRLEVLKQTIRSAHEHHLDDLGKIYVSDDSSPFRQEVEEACGCLGVNYFFNFNVVPDTKAGLVCSMKKRTEFEPLLLVVDDCVFGKGIKERIDRIVHEDIPYLDGKEVMWGTIGLFSCYDQGVRKKCKYPGVDLWQVPLCIFYAQVCHIFSPYFMEYLEIKWKKITDKISPMPQMCDDLWISKEAGENGMFFYNTMHDYAQHTGGGVRSFGNVDEQISSFYTSPEFIGE